MFEARAARVAQLGVALVDQCAGRTFAPARPQRLDLRPALRLPAHLARLHAAPVQVRARAALPLVSLRLAGSRIWPLPLAGVRAGRPAGGPLPFTVYLRLLRWGTPDVVSFVERYY